MEDEPVMMELDFDDIGPIEQKLDECYRTFSSGFTYKGVFWDWRCAKNAVEDLRARRISMSRRAFEAYGSFDEWVSAHRHSAPAIQTELYTRLEIEEDNPVEGLESYIASLDDIRFEIDEEISEAKDWIEHFTKLRGGPEATE